MASLVARLSALAPAELPRPEPDAFARAVLGGRGPLPRAVTRWAGQWYPVLEALGLVLLLVALATGAGWLGLAGLLLAGFVDWAADQSDHRFGRMLALNGWGPPLRALLRSLVMVALAGPWYVVAALGVQVGWLACVAGATWLSLRQPPLRFVPGGTAQPADTVAFARSYARGFSVPGVLLALDSAAATAAVLAPGLVGGVVAGSAAAAGLGYGAWALLGALRLAARPGGQAVVDDLTAAGPTAMVHVSGGIGQSKYLVNPWLPAFEAVPRGVVVAVREASQLSPLAPTGLPVVYTPQSRHVEAVTVPTVRVAFFVANGQKNGDLWRNPHLRHVFLGHGDSDKATSATPIARLYDQVWVAGRAGIDRYRAAGIDIPEERFAIIGRPQVAPLAVGPRGGTPRVVLYAPTFEGYYEESNYASLETMGPAMVRHLLATHPGVAIWFKPHPATGVQRPGMRQARDEVNALLRQAGAPHRCIDDEPGVDLQDCFQAADVLISDVSSVVSDFLYTERPIIVTNPQGMPPAEFRTAFPSQAASYLVGPGLAGFAEAVTDALGSDPLAAARRELKRYVLGDLPQGPIVAFVEATQRLAQDA